MALRPAAPVRLAELVASLSLATDLGLGQPQEHILRQTVIATRLSAWAGASDDEQAATFYVSLLAWVGCLSDSYELGRWFDDDGALRAASYTIDRAGPRCCGSCWRGLTPIRLSIMRVPGRAIPRERPADRDGVAGGTLRGDRADR